MKPRQTMKNYHNSNVPPHHPGGGSSGQNLSTPLPPALRDIDLVKLGLSLEDLPNLQVPPSNSSSSSLPNPQDEAVKCLQAIYGKNSAEILQNLSSLNDWPMQSVSPSDYLRPANSASGVVAGGVGCSGSSTSNNNTSAGVGEAGFNPITNNTHVIGGQNKQELQHQFINSQQQQHSSSQLGQHFRSVSASNMSHSSQQHHQPPALPPTQQQKSVLSLQHQLQNDLSNRRLNHHHQHHHQHDPHTNSSLANLNSVNAMPNSTTDSNSTSTLIGGASVGGSISSKISHVSNLMETIGGMEHLLFDNPLIINKDSTSSNQQQSMLRHQQLQKLLKATGSQQKPSPSSMSHRSDTTQSQRNIASTSNMLQHHLSSSTPASTISPPQTTAFSSVPKSLLNLAACSSSSSAPSTSNSSLATAAKFSSMVSQLNMISGRNSVSNISNAKSSTKLGANNGVNSQDSLKSNLRSSNVNESGLSRLLSSSAATTSSQNVVSTRSNSKQQQQLQLSLLSDDQSTTANKSNFRNAYNVCGAGNISKIPTTSASHIQKNNPSSSNSNNNNNNSSTSKEAFLANLQERAARVGVIIGEINKPVQLSSMNLAGCSSVNNLPNSNTITPQNTATTVNISSNTSKEEFNINTVDRKEIESALSRVEARNDLSLLYPPMLLASNSQKQINALSAGIHGSEDSDIFTKEVKKIVLEECNIIYECKECNNLFRSLANLVRHKRTYCLEQNSERNSLEMNKRPCANAILPLDQRSSSITLTNNNSLSARLGGDSSNNNSTSNEVHNIEQDQNNVTLALGGDGTNTNNTSLIMGVDAELTSGSIDKNNDSNYQTMRQTTSTDRRNLSNMLRMFQSRERKNREKDMANFQQRANNPVSVSQSNLSELLQSQPKQHRLPVSRDGGSALLGALSMPPNSTHDNNNLYSAFESDKNIINCAPNDVQEELVRNSSLAKTLLSEKVRITNPRQSLIELSKVEIMQQKTTYNSNSNVKRAAPKRKFLEDCIQKVKRDKFHTEDDEDPQLQLNSLALNSDVTLSKITKDQDKEREADQDMTSCLAGDDSDVDSDILMIDLDEPRKKSPIKKGKRRMSTAASSTTSSSNSSVCRGLNTSSALLKALTRPVDPKRPYSSASSSVNTDDRSSSNLSKQIQNQHSQTREKELEIVTQHQHTEEVVAVFEKQTCDICEVDYKNLNALIKHIVAKHTDEKMVYPCIFCSFSFITLENVCRHILDIHQKPMAQVQRLKEVVRSRSFLSSDFLGCSDHPAVTNTVTQEKQANSDLDVEKSASPIPEDAADVEKDKMEADANSSKLNKEADIGKDQDEATEGELVIDGEDGDAAIDVGARSNYDDDQTLNIGSAKSPPSRRNTEEQSRMSEPTTNQDDDVDDREEFEKEAVLNGDEESMDTYEEASVDEEEDVSESEEKGEEEQEDEEEEDDFSSDKQVDKELVEPEASVGDDDESGDSVDKVQNSIGYYEDSEEEKQKVRKNNLTIDDETSSIRREESDLIVTAASSTNQLDEVAGEDSIEGLGTSSSSSSSAATTNHNHHHHHHHHHQPIKGNDSSQQHKDLKLSPATKGNTGAGGGGGIMKLKIQLKTRPDDKGKVYEIV